MATEIGDEAEGGGGGAVLDRRHLERQTMGDAALAAELMQLLLKQIDALDGALRPADPAARAALGHRMLGSARSLGAFRLAAAARALSLDGADGPAAERMLAEARHLARLLRGDPGLASVD